MHERTRPKRLNLRGRSRAVAYHSPETLDNRTLHVLVDSGKLTQDTIGLMLARKFNWHDDEDVHWLLEHGADPNWPLWGSRPLHWALRQGTPIHYFQWLLDHGADPLLPDKNGTVPVAEAARRGRADVLELFEQRGVVIALEGDDRFLAACARANDTEARTLAAADLSVVGRAQSRNPGMLADFAGAGNAAAVRLLLDLGFDAGMARIQPDWVAGETALHVAAAHGRQTVAELLIARGAPLEARRHKGWSPLGVAFRCLEQQSEWTPNEYTLPIAETLITAGASVEDAGLTLTAAVCLGRGDDIARLAKEAGTEEKQKALAAAAYNGNGRNISCGRAGPVISNTSSAKAPGPSSTPKSPVIFAAGRARHDESRQCRSPARKAPPVLPRPESS